MVYLINVISKGDCRITVFIKNITKFTRQEVIIADNFIIYIYSYLYKSIQYF